MSRNFELLQKLGKEQVLNPNDTVAASAPAPAPAPVASAPAMSPPVTPAAPASSPTADQVWTAPAATIPTFTASRSLEPVSALAQQIFIAPGTEAPRAVVFASTEPGAGCTWVCAHTAQALAGRVTGSVCIVDANFASPGLSEIFNLGRGVGLAEALAHSDPIRRFARQTSQSNLWVIPAGVPTAESMLASDRMRLRITELRSEFDFVLLDSPAMSLANDAISMASFSDGAVLVLKAHSSKRTAAKQAVEEMQAGKAVVLGAVLNQRRYPIPQKLYDWL